MEIEKQNTVGRSSAESEYRSMALIVSELIWLISFIQMLGVDVPRPIQLFKHCKSAMHIANNPVFHERTKYIEIDCHFIRKKVQQGLVHPEYF